MLPTNLLLIVIHRKHDWYYRGECNGYRLSAKDRKQLIKQLFVVIWHSWLHFVILYIRFSCFIPYKQGNVGATHT